jgi:hypothetical protein
MSRSPGALKHEQFNYRVTEQQGCTCKGWYYSKQRTAGVLPPLRRRIPRAGSRNKAIIDQDQGEKARAARKATVSSSDPGEPVMSETEKGRL